MISFLDEAVADMKTVRATGSLYVLMLGNLYAQKRDWPNAFQTWLEAAAAGPLEPLRARNDLLLSSACAGRAGEFVG
jgi:hypothetical protein